MNAIISGIVRALLALFAGTVGTSDADLGTALNRFFDSLGSGDPQAVGAAAVTLGVIVWSIYDKRHKAIKTEAK